MGICLFTSRWCTNLRFSQGLGPAAQLPTPAPARTRSTRGASATPHPATHLLGRNRPGSPTPRPPRCLGSLAALGCHCGAPAEIQVEIQKRRETTHFCWENMGGKQQLCKLKLVFLLSKLEAASPTITSCGVLLDAFFPHIQVSYLGPIAIKQERHQIETLRLLDCEFK